jgi:serpin B
MATLVEGNTKLALNLYSQLCTQADNLFFSPYSISTAIAMTAAGAKGKTATQIDRVFSFNLPPASRPPAFAQLTYQLTDAQGYQLAIANRLWAQKDFPLLSPFVKTSLIYTLLFHYKLKCEMWVLTISCCLRMF